MTAATAPIPINAPPVRKLAEWALRVPLVAKLAGANAIIVLVAWFATWWSTRSVGGDYDALIVPGLALVAGLLVNAWLVHIALRPIRTIEDTTERFWKGDLAARVPWSAVGDRNIDQLSAALNLLLETNEQERIRLRALAEGVMRYEERLREETARVLQESHAQSFAGLMYRISAAIAECENEDCRKDLEAARLIAQKGVEDLRELSSHVHPRLLQEFGLIAAVRHLARRLQKETKVAIRVDHEEVLTMQSLSMVDKDILYRVTEEAMRNSIAHGSSEIDVAIRAGDSAVQIEIADNGTAEPMFESKQNASLWLMRERLAFIGGTFAMALDPQGGAHISMRLPVGGTIMDVNHSTWLPEPYSA